MGLRVICLWPGLPGAWLRGQVPQLAWAVAWGWASSMLLLATFVWPYWFSPIVNRLLWFTFIVAWCCLVAWEHWRFRGWFTLVKPQATEAFSAAQAEYLKGNWFAAEAGLLAILHEKSDDADALLLLVSVLRRTRRWQPASRRLQQLELLDAAAKWHHEIARERRLLQAGLLEVESTAEKVA